MHSIFGGHSTEIFRQSKIKGPLILSIPFSVRSDTLSDMVSHMSDSVGLVHQMPYSCDRSGLPATLEKVSLFYETQCTVGKIRHIFMLKLKSLKI